MSNTELIFKFDEAFYKIPELREKGDGGFEKKYSNLMSYGYKHLRKEINYIKKLLVTFPALENVIVDGTVVSYEELLIYWKKLSNMSYYKLLENTKCLTELSRLKVYKRLRHTRNTANLNLAIKAVSLGIRAKKCIKM